jgi:hypothetical protein
MRLDWVDRDGSDVRRSRARRDGIAWRHDFCVASSRVQGLHSIESKSRENLEIAHGLHTREISN